MKTSTFKRNQIVGFRAATDFTNRLDVLCQRLGRNRSQVARYALQNLMRSISNSPEGVAQLRSEIF